MRRAFVALIVAAIFTLIAGVAQAKAVKLTPAQEQVASEIEYLLRCPVCTGQSVAESNAEVSQQIKEKIREMLAEGKTKDEILNYYVNRYGEWILNKPPVHGAGLVAWILPVAVVVVGLGVLVAFLSRGKRKKGAGEMGTSGQSPVHSSSDLDQQIRERLKDYV